MCMITEPILASDSEPSITLPDSNNAYCVDYDKRLDLEVYYNGKKAINTYQVKKGTLIGIAHYYIGRYRNKKKTGKKYYDGMLIKVGMEPRQVYAYNKKGKKKKRYGFSQYLSLKSSLPENCQIQGTTPNNSTTGSSSYSIGIATSSDAPSLSGSVNIESEYCNVTDNSQLSKEKFCVSYDYKPSWNIFEWSSTSDRSKMLFNQTWQAGTCEWTSSKCKYSTNLTIYAKFGLSNSKDGGGILTPMKKYSSGNTITSKVKYSKKMK